MGEVLQALGQRSMALNKFERALTLIPKQGAEQERIEILNSVCSIQTSVGQYKKALPACSLALRLSRANNYPSGEAQAFSNIGMTYYELGDLSRALEHQESALRRWEDLADRKGQAQSLLRMGYAAVVVGDIQKALESYQRGLVLSRSAGDASTEAFILTALGNLHAVSGGRQQALDYYGKALPLAEQLGQSEVRAEVFSAMGYVYYQLGDLENALRYREQALALYRSMPDLWGECSLHLSLGRVYRALGAQQEALDHFNPGLAIARSLPNAHLESSILKEIGGVYDTLGETEKALDHYKQSLALSHRSGDPRDEADALNQIGNTFKKLARAQEALACFKNALTLARSVGDLFTEAVTLSNLAQAQRDLGQLDAAKAQIEEALKIIESLRTNVASHNLRSSYFATVRHHYELYIDVLMRLDQQRPGQGFAAAGFEASERARARTLLETLKESSANIREGADSALIDRERTIQQTLNAKAERRMQLLAAGQKEQAAAVAKELDDLAIQYDEVTAQIRTSSPRYAALTQPRTLNVSETQEILDDDTLLIEYALGDERSYVWTVSRTELHSYELPGRAIIEEAASRFYSLLTASNREPGETFAQHQERVAKADTELPSASRSLGALLLQPLISELGSRRLLIVADGALQYIPFQALTAPSGTDRHDGLAESEADQLPPLIFQHEIVNESSASTLALVLDERAKRPQAPSGVAVLADPVFDADDSRVRPQKSPPGSRNSVADDMRSRDLQRALRDVTQTDGTAPIPRLLASRVEANAIMSFVPWGSGFVAIGFDASRQTVTQTDFRKYRIVHFATHGVIDSKHPELSGIVLSLVDQAGRPQDGFLRLHDIYNLNLPADLVVLSACNTGLGKDVRGEGLIGLTRGFMYAGASGVVASLWRVDDEATAELMKQFYIGMFERKLKPAAALREAQILMSKQQRWHAAYYWAAFIIQGRYNQNISGSSSSSSSAIGWLSLGILGLATLAFLVMKRRRRTL